MKKNVITLTTVVLLLGVIIFIGFCALFKPFDGKSDYSGYISSIELDTSGNALIETKLFDTDWQAMKFKTLQNVKVYDLDGEAVDVGALEIGMLITVDFPLFKHCRKEGEYYLAKKIHIIAD